MGNTKKFLVRRFLNIRNPNPFRSKIIGDLDGKRRKKNVSTNVAEKISTMILTERRFRPGDKLPNERDFAEELGVSRTSIREALKLLNANGMLEIRRGVGAFVRETPGIPRDPLGLSQIEDKKKLMLD